MKLYTTGLTRLETKSLPHAYRYEVQIHENKSIRILLEKDGDGCNPTKWQSEALSLGDNDDVREDQLRKCAKIFVRCLRGTAGNGTGEYAILESTPTASTKHGQSSIVLVLCAPIRSPAAVAKYRLVMEKALTPSQRRFGEFKRRVQVMQQWCADWMEQCKNWQFPSQPEGARQHADPLEELMCKVLPTLQDGQLRLQSESPIRQANVATWMAFEVGTCYSFKSKFPNGITSVEWKRLGGTRMPRLRFYDRPRCQGFEEWTQYGRSGAYSGDELVITRSFALVDDKFEWSWFRTMRYRDLPVDSIYADHVMERVMKEWERTASSTGSRK